MDDLVLFADEKSTLWDGLQRVGAYLHENLQLRIKQDSVLLAPVSQGLPFLGFRIFPGVIRIGAGGARRFRRKMRLREKQYLTGEIDDEQLVRSTAGLLGFVRQAQTRNFRARFFKGSGR